MAEPPGGYAVAGEGFSRERASSREGPGMPRVMGIRNFPRASILPGGFDEGKRRGVPGMPRVMRFPTVATSTGFPAQPGMFPPWGTRDAARDGE